MTRFIPLTILAALHVGACVPPSITPPAPPTHEVSRAFAGSYDAVWDGAVDWFSESNIPIGQIERASGLITSEHRLRADEELIDCGNVDSGNSMLVDSDRTANLNVRVRETEAGILVQVNVFGRGRFTFHDPLTNSTSAVEASRCESSGAVEAWLFDHIEESLGG